MTKSIVLFFLASFCLNSSSRAQQYKRDWIRHYGHTLMSESRSLIEVSDGSLLVSGYTIREHSFRADAWLVKLDPITGKKVWERTYGDKDWDEVTSVVETSDEHLMVLGWTHPKNGNRTDIWLMRLDLDGNLIWEKFYGNKRWDEAYDIVEMKDGGFAIAASSNKKKEDDDIHVLKVNPKGDLLWSKEFGGMGRDKAHGVYSLANGDVLVVGYQDLEKPRREDAWAARFSSNGDLRWQHTYGGEYTDAVHDAIELPNGNLLLVGFSRSHTKGKQSDLWLLKLDKDGTELLSKTYGMKKFEKGRNIIQTRDGGFAIAAFTFSKGMGNSDLWLLKLDKELNISWEGTFGGEGHDIARSIIELDDGALVIAGKIDLSEISAFLIVRYNREEEDHSH